RNRGPQGLPQHRGLRVRRPDGRLRQVARARRDHPRAPRRVGLRVRVPARDDEPASDGGRRDGVPDADRALHVRLVEPRAGDRRVRRRRVAVRAPARRRAAQGQVFPEMSAHEARRDPSARSGRDMSDGAQTAETAGRASRVLGAARPRLQRLRYFQALAAAAVLSVALQTFVAARAAEPVAAERFMVVAANPHATRAGYEIIRAGGSAVDAAIAVQAVLSLVEPQSSGIGGGAFMLYFDAPDEDGDVAEIIAYEGRETAPMAA